MKNKITIRVLIYAVLVPLALFIGLYFGLYKSLVIPMNILELSIVTFPDRTPEQNSYLMGEKWAAIVTRLKEIGCGLPSEQRASALYNFYLKHKNDELGKVFYANYVINLETPDAKQKNKYKKSYSYPSAKEYTISDSQYLNALKNGEKIEPQNMLYNLFLAEFYLDRGVIGEGEFKSIKESKILDKANYQKGIYEISKLINKTYFKTYSKEYEEYKLSLIPDPTSFTENFIVSYLSFDGRFNSNAQFRESARKIRYAMQMMSKNEQQAEAVKLADKWSNISLKLITDSNTLTDYLVFQASSTILAKESMEVYKRAGLNAKADKIYHQLEEIKSWRNTDRQSKNYEKIEKYSPVLIQIMLPVLGAVNLDENELAPARYVEYLQMYMAVVISIILFLILLIIWSLAKGIFWLVKTKNVVDKPTILILSWNDYTRAIGFGIILPIVFYYFVSVTPFIGRLEYSLDHNLPITIFLTAIFLLAIIFIPIWIIGKAIRKQLEEQNINVPDSKSEKKQKLITYSFFVVFIVAITAFISVILNSDLSNIITICCGGVVLLLFAALIWVSIRFYKSHRNYPTFYGTLPLSVVPILAISIILITSICIPFLKSTERYWILKDKYTVVRKGLNNGGVPGIERVSVDMRKARMLKLLDE